MFILTIISFLSLHFPVLFCFPGVKYQIQFVEMADDGIKYGINNWFDDNNEIVIKCYQTRHNIADTNSNEDTQFAKKSD